jgi:hypothetical protein
MHKYCIALSPERHRGPWHTALFSSRSSPLPPVTREATTILIVSRLVPDIIITESRQMDRDVAVQWQNEDQTRTERRASKAKVNDENCRRTGQLWCCGQVNRLTVCMLLVLGLLLLSVHSATLHQQYKTVSHVISRMNYHLCLLFSAILKHICTVDRFRY